MIAEEEAAAGRIESLSGDYFWLVDPLDGTKEFIAGNDEFTVNIALIHAARPALGVVYAPALDAMYAGTGPPVLKLPAWRAVRSWLAPCPRVVR